MSKQTGQQKRTIRTGNTSFTLTSALSATDGTLPEKALRKDRKTIRPLIYTPGPDPQPSFSLDEMRSRYYAERLYTLLKNGRFLSAAELVQQAEDEAYSGEDISNQIVDTRLHPKLISLLESNGIHTIDDLCAAWPGKLLLIPRLHIVSHAQIGLELIRLKRLKPFTSDQALNNIRSDDLTKLLEKGKR